MSLARRALLASAPTLMVVSARAQSMKVKLGTALPGGGVELYGIGLVDGVHAVDPTFDIAAVTTKGIMDNVAQLEAGTLDAALVFGEVAHELFTGVGGKPPTKLRIIAVMYSTPGMFVVRSDSRYRAIADLKGRKVVWNARGSGLVVQARYVLDGLGLDLEKDFDPVYTERLADGPDMVIQGTAAALWGGGKRWPGFVTVASSSRGARFVVPSKAEIARIREKYSFLAELTVPAGLYPGQYDPITTIGTWGFILARADLDESVAFRFAQALHRCERTSMLSKQLVETTVRNTLAAVPQRERLHPGVLAYYKKANLL